MTFDWDDHCPENDAMPWMLRLKAVNPAFRATLFTIPGLCTPKWLSSHPSWIELQPHGWLHPSPYECADWTKERMLQLLDEPIIQSFGQPLGWKSPGWQTSDGVYQALVERGVWIADQHLEDVRRPAALRTYFYEDGPQWHGHIDDCGGAVTNGLEQTWDRVIELVQSAEEFRWCSEAAR